MVLSLSAFGGVSLPTSVQDFERMFERAGRPDTEKFPVRSAVAGYMVYPHQGQVNHNAKFAVFRSNEEGHQVWLSTAQPFYDSLSKFFSWSLGASYQYWPTTATKQFVTVPRKEKIGGVVMGIQMQFRTLEEGNETLILERRTCRLEKGCHEQGYCDEYYNVPCGLRRSCTKTRKVFCNINVAKDQLASFGVFRYSQLVKIPPVKTVPRPE